MTVYHLLPSSVTKTKTDKRIFWPVYITITGGLRSAQSFCKLLRLIGICGKMSGQSDDSKCSTWQWPFSMENFMENETKKIRRQQGFGKYLQYSVIFVYIRVPYRTNQGQWGLPRSHQERPKRPKTAKWRQQSWKTFLLWTSPMPVYFMELIKDTEDFKEAIRNINSYKGPTWQKGSFKGEGCLDDPFFYGNVINLKCFGLLKCQDT